MGAVSARQDGFLSQAAASIEWHTRGVCRSEGDPEWFFPSSGNSHAYTEHAKALCDRCPVRDTCLVAGWDEQGTWGGLSKEERLQAQNLGFTAHEVIKIRDDKEGHEAE